MRGIETPVREIRKKVFTEIAKFAYEQRDLEEIEDLPYELVKACKNNKRNQTEQHC